MSLPTNADPLIASIAAGFPLRPIPAPSVRPWAGRRLGDADANVGEMWLAGPDSLVETTRGEQVSLGECERGTAHGGVRARLEYLDLFFHTAIVLMADDGVKAENVPGVMMGLFFTLPEHSANVKFWLFLKAQLD